MKTAMSSRAQRGALSEVEWDEVEGSRPRWSLDFFDSFLPIYQSVKTLDGIILTWRVDFQLNSFLYKWVC